MVHIVVTCHNVKAFSFCVFLHWEVITQNITNTSNIQLHSQYIVGSWVKIKNYIKWYMYYIVCIILDTLVLAGNGTGTGALERLKCNVCIMWLHITLFLFLLLSCSFILYISVCLFAKLLIQFKHFNIIYCQRHS